MNLRIAMQHERFVVPERSHFKYLFDSHNEANIGELITIALTDLEEANCEKVEASMGIYLKELLD